MPVHDARYVSGPGDFSGVKSMRFQHQSYAQAGDPNDDPSAHDESILAKFPGSREKDSVNAYSSGNPDRAEGGKTCGEIFLPSSRTI